MKLTKKAFAKINLTLEILGTRRGDGFHDIDGHDEGAGIIR